MNILKACLVVSLSLSVFAADCGPGGLLCASGTCHYPTYIEGCLTYASSTACQQCQYNYILSENKCMYSPPNDNSDCCRSYSLNGQCNQCTKGLVLIQGKCVDRKIVGCLTKSKTGSCLNCAIQYNLFGGLCYKKITGCKKQNTVGACQVCQEDKYQTYKGLCIPKVIIDQTCQYPWTKFDNGDCGISGCRDYSDFGCVQCQSGFRLLPDGACKKGSIEGCNIYALDGFCKTCKKPFYTEFSGFCLSFGCVKVDNLGKCLQCDTSKGFGMTADGYCKISNCLVAGQKQCLVCEKGYIETRGGCKRQDSSQIVCTTCARNFFLSENGECKPRQPGCISYSKSRCSACQQNLYLNLDYICVPKQPGCIYKDGSCLSCQLPFKYYSHHRCAIEGCTKFDENGCLSCRNPYVLTKNGFCTFENCLQVSDGRCLSCNEGYAISHEGFCYQVDLNCKAYNFEGACIECKLGFYFDKNSKQTKCKSQKFGCNYVDGRCVSCRAPFQFNSKQQSCEIDGCLTYFLGGCQTCAASYDLRYNRCKLPFCLISHKGHCAECDPDYILKSDGLCVNKDEFCWKYDGNGNCVECAPDYYLSKLTGKCKPRQPGCLYNDNDKCYACDKPFYFDGIRCEIYGCMKLASKGCDQCFYPMEVKNGLCSVVNCDRMKDDKCVICKPGFIIAADGSCQRQDPKCLVYGQNGCKKCVKGYRIDSTGLCQYADDHCWDFSEKGTCTNCDRLYFLNSFKKCEIKDSNCAAYCGGRCIECKNNYYVYRGLCYPNAKGCSKQVNIKKCEICQDGYKLQSGVCIPVITKLNWNSINMDFWSGDSDQNIQISKQVFSVGKTNKLNLDGAIIKSKGKIIYSSVVSNRKAFQVDDDCDADGWTPSGSGKQFIGVLLQKSQTFYALDIKYTKGNTLRKFAVEFSQDGKIFKKNGQFTTTKNLAGAVQTFYFTPVLARAIRIIVIQGQANIKVEFYYSNGENNYPSSSSSQLTYIQNQTQVTILDALRGEIFSTKQGCVDKQLCWMGLQLCEAKQVIGFSLVPNKQSNGLINMVSVKYSLDGVKFECYKDCKDIQLVNNSYRLDPRVTASKLRVFPSKWTGQPSYSITFEY